MSIVYSTHVKSPYEKQHIFMYDDQPCELLGVGCDTDLQKVVSIKLRCADGKEVEVWARETGFPGLSYALKQ